jgi:hypothetical protein
VEEPEKPPRPAPSDDQHRRHPLATSTSTPTERHARASDQHVRRWRRLSAPDQPWRARDIARLIGITNLNSFCVQMSQWSRQGLIIKTGPARYTLAS